MKALSTIYYGCLKAILIFLFLGCNKSVEEISTTPDHTQTGEFIEFVINKGEHFSNGSYKQFKGKELSFTAIFDSSCIYTTRSSENLGDINKLYGFSDCGTRHQENSARVGWVWNGRDIELFAYCYANGQRSSQLLGTARINELVQLSIAVTAEQYIFTYKDEKTHMQRHCNDPQASGYMLYPYFGGDETAPHDIRIRIR